MTINLWEVGGAVRDDLLGIRSKDIDFVTDATYPELKEFLANEGFTIFLEKPEYLTIRARFPENFDRVKGRDVAGKAADFVVARKDGYYTDHRRPDEVTPGSLMDDLSRRDFTVNAIARAADGSIVDPFNGRVHLEQRLLVTVGNPYDRLHEDPLRWLRALRFSITKGFDLDWRLESAMKAHSFAPLIASVSVERRREELHKMFAHDTRKTIRLLSRVDPVFFDAVFSDGLWLEPTLRKP